MSIRWESRREERGEGEEDVKRGGEEITVLEGEGRGGEKERGDDGRAGGKLGRERREEEEGRGGGWSCW
jgi:hypothetical protein